MRLTILRPYRNYLVTPIIFCCTALFLIVIAAFTRPFEALAGLGLIVISTLPYVWARVVRKRERAKVVKIELDQVHEEEVADGAL